MKPSSFQYGEVHYFTSYYPDVQAFTATYRKAEKPPEKQSVRDQLRRLQEDDDHRPA